MKFRTLPVVTVFPERRGPCRLRDRARPWRERRVLHGRQAPDPPVAALTLTDMPGVHGITSLV